MAKESVLEMAKELSPSDRFELAMDLWDAVDAAGGPPELPLQMRAEVERRRVAEALNPTPAVD